MKWILLVCVLAVGVVPGSWAASAVTREEADQAYEEDRYEDIVRLFTVLLEANPSKEDTVDFLEKRVYGLIKLKRYQDALDEYRRLQDLGVESPSLLNSMSVALYVTGEWAESYALGRRAYLMGREHGLSEARLAIFQDNFTSTSWEMAAKFPAFAEAVEQGKNGNHDRVSELVSALLSEHPEGGHELACRTERAKAYVETGRAGQALDDWLRVRELSGDTPAMLEQLGGCYLILHNNRMAYETYRLIVQRDVVPADKARHRMNLEVAGKRLDNDAARLQREADAAVRSGDMPAAFAAYELAMALPGTRSDSFGWSVYQFSRLVSESYFERLDGVKERLRQKAREGDVAGIHEECRNLRALAPFSEDYVDKLRADAFASMLQAPAQRPALELVYKVLKLEQSPKHAKKAIKLMDEAIRRAPAVADLYVWRASWWTLLKDARALADLDAAVRLFGSESVSTLVGRGLHHEALGNRAAAMEQFHRAAAIRSDFYGRLPYQLRQDYLNQPVDSSPPSPIRERITGPHGFPLDPDESNRFSVAAYRSATNTDVEPESLGDRRRHAFCQYSWAIALNPLASGPRYGRGEWLRGSFNHEALQDFVVAANLGNNRAAEAAEIVRNQLPPTGYIPRVRPPEQAGDGSSAGSGNRYCMRCRATGTIYAYEDDVDAHNNRVRAERKVTCPECGGRGVR